MRWMKACFHIWLVAFFLLGTAQASSGRSIHAKAGTSAFSFLKIGVGARPLGLGGAFVSVAEDANALYWNPAGISQLKDQQLTLSYVNYLLDIHSGFVGYVLPRDDRLCLGAALNYFSYGEFQRTTVEDPTGNQLGTFGALDLSLAFSGAYVVSEGFFLGGTAKVIYGKLEDYSSDAYALDLGGLYVLPDDRTRLGFSLQNLGFQRSGYSSDNKDGLAPILRVGASRQLEGLPLLLTVDGYKPTDHHFNVNMGGEIHAGESLSLRLGWSSLGLDQQVGPDKDNLAGFSGGLGVQWQTYRLDYAYSSMAELGEVHRATLTLDL
jgi:hypothetical protein